MNHSRMLTLALAALLACGALLTTAPTYALALTVTRFDDPPLDGCGFNGCSLREAVIVANTNAEPTTITLPAGTYTLTIGGENEDAAATGDLDITHDITLIGAGATTTIIQAGTTIDSSIDRVFYVANGATVALRGITVQHGRSGIGGGIRNDGTLTLTDSIVSSNTSGIGGGIANSGTLTLRNSTLSGNTTSSGGGIDNEGTLTVTSSIVSDNTVTTNGGGLHNTGRATITDSTISGNTATGGGGGMSNDNGGTLTLTNSTISGNTAMENGGGIKNDAVLTLATSTISSNTAGNQGGGIDNRNTGRLVMTASTISGNTTQRYDGGGIFNHDGATLTLANSTISGNSASSFGGGISNNHNGALTLNNVTIASNRADTSVNGEGTGGGLYNGDASTLVLGNTLIGTNTIAGTAAAPSDCAGTMPLTSQGYNLIGTTDGCAISDDTTSNNKSGDITGTDPQLGPLQDNGGPTLTHALLPGSPAIDAGDPAGCADAQGQLLAADQRGGTRPQGARCDIGAFELETAAVPAPSSIRVFLPIMVK